MNSGAEIIVSSGGILDVLSGTLQLADDQISGDKLHGGVYSNFRSTGIDDNAISSTITIDGNGHVIIGATSAAGNTKLSIIESNVTSVPDVDADELSIENEGGGSGRAGITILSGATSGISAIHFGDSDNPKEGQIQFNNNGDDFFIKINGGNKFAFTNAGTMQFLSFTSALSINDALVGGTSSGSVNTYIKISVGGTTSYIKGYSSI